MLRLHAQARPHAAWAVYQPICVMLTTSRAALPPFPSVPSSVFFVLVESHGARDGVGGVCAHAVEHSQVRGYFLRFLLHMQLLAGMRCCLQGRCGRLRFCMRYVHEEFQHDVQKVALHHVGVSFVTTHVRVCRG
jgi:hypothetical protein